MPAKQFFNRESADDRAARKAKERTAAINRVNRHGTNMFFQAVESGKLSEVAKMLAEGADIMARTTQAGMLSGVTGGVPYQTGATPLHAACLLGSGDIVDFLIEKGADPYATDSAGHTPLDYAIRSHGYYAADLERKESSRFTMQRFVDKAATRVDRFEQIIAKLMARQAAPAVYEMPEKFKASRNPKDIPPAPPLP